MKLRVAVVLLLLTLGGCVGAPAPAPAPDRQLVRQGFGTLPGVVLGSGPELVVTYPEETLFSPGAVLPLAGGTARLDPLAQMLAAHPELSWQGTVRVAPTADPGYDQQLAAERAALLTRYFRRRDLDDSRLHLAAAVEAGPSLELRGSYAPASARTSSRVKE